MLRNSYFLLLFTSESIVHSNRAAIAVPEQRAIMSALTRPEPRLIRISEVLTIIPVSKSTWFRGVANGTFPRPVKIGNVSAWWHHEIVALAERLASISVGNAPAKPSQSATPRRTT